MKGDLMDGVMHSPVSLATAPASATGARGPRRPSRPRRQVRPQPVYTVGEEVANSVTHGIGCLLAIAALVLLVVRAAGSAQPFALASAIVYGCSLILEYLMSTLYHAIPPSAGKRFFRTCDHSCIFILIAGSYTPFLLGPLRDHGGVWMMGLVWGIALVGIGLAVFMRDRRPGWLQPALCAALGWIVIFRLPTLVIELDPACLALLVAGGLAYSVGIAFYAATRVRYMHSVWHLWVMAGSVCHFLAVYLFLL